MAPLRAGASKGVGAAGIAAMTAHPLNSLASLRWHYPDQVQRVFLTRASRCDLQDP
ncbi:hypothetical protein BN2497_9615 [Janthinobacterium sp. CG23_2]|nr:hypothetical protein BN2497_9615 [Janthinobacterium sp. CG23_2]CUU31205.1 hypothetical protein BN3177_9615 [Janthinobacterium sp. CG23_2]